MKTHGLLYFRATGTTEATGLTAAQVSAALIEFWTLISAPGAVAGVNPAVRIDHVWIYTDK